ncbi:hypothetical protein HBI26_113040 [Parastagonospora nodorum]|nr:hypothetical protein HBI62_181390 [Parastagonospora nodorum]KAH5538239.1 hypothetical protein HBI27_131700 [Parastagonospora nodorum]KAH5591378.1 hypothetical protein HBI26_113040 [Parastagonospora nodorum]KAH5598442.1 hypothetical protein HBI45_161100 [Parastagonospora nodorum]KAH6147058.1 hypothetical protein HBI63_162880 [Parastagonospora nodorum]
MSPRYHGSFLCLGLPHLGVAALQNARWAGRTVEYMLIVISTDTTSLCISCGVRRAGIVRQRQAAPKSKASNAHAREGHGLLRSSQGKWLADRWRMFVSGPPGACPSPLPALPTQSLLFFADMATNTTRHTGLPPLPRVLMGNMGSVESQSSMAKDRPVSVYDPVSSPPLLATPNFRFFAVFL